MKDNGPRTKQTTLTATMQPTLYQSSTISILCAEEWHVENFATKYAKELSYNAQCLQHGDSALIPQRYAPTIDNSPALVRMKFHVPQKIHSIVFHTVPGTTCPHHVLVFTDANSISCTHFEHAKPLLDIQLDANTIVQKFALKIPKNIKSLDVCFHVNALFFADYFGKQSWCCKHAFAGCFPHGLFGFHNTHC